MEDELKYDLSYHFDHQLREVANDPADMRRAIADYQAQLAEVDAAEKVQLMGLLGTYQRILCQLDDAKTTLEQSVALGQQSADKRTQFVNRLRLAHTYQWRGEYERSSDLFSQLIAETESDPDLSDYRDFAYQHAAKNHFDRGQYAEALALFEKALTIRQAKGDASLIDSTEWAIKVTRRHLDGDGTTSESD